MKMISAEPRETGQRVYCSGIAENMALLLRMLVALGLVIGAALVWPLVRLRSVRQLTPRRRRRHRRGGHYDERGGETGITFHQWSPRQRAASPAQTVAVHRPRAWSTSLSRSLSQVFDRNTPLRVRARGHLLNQRHDHHQQPRDHQQRRTRGRH